MVGELGVNLRCGYSWVELNQNQYGICSFISVIPAHSGILTRAGYLLEAWIPAAYQGDEGNYTYHNGCGITNRSGKTQILPCPKSEGDTPL